MERWKINLYSVWFSQIISIMSFSFGFPFIPFYIQDLGITDPDMLKLYTGILSTAPAVTMAVMAPIWGMAADRWGKKLMLLRAMFFASLVITGMGLVANTDQLLVLRILQGVFTGTVTASTALVAAGTPSYRLSYAMGFMSSSTFIGASAGPVIGGFLAEFAGYRVSFILGGVLMLLDFLLVLFLVKEEKTLPEPVEAKAEGRKFSLFTWYMIIMLFIIFVLRVTRSIFTPYLPLFVQEMLSGTGGATRYTGIINGVTGLMTALSGLTVSRLGDKYSKTVLMKIFMAGGMLISIPIAFAGNLVAFTVGYGLFFFIVGGIEPIVFSTTSEQTPREKRGMLFGVQGLVGNAGFALSPMLGSAVSINYSVQSTLFLIPVMLVPGLIALFFAGKASKNGQETPMDA